MSSGNILLISYHFYPSPEVGAKRPSETARYLMERGYDVTILRAWEDEFPADWSAGGLEKADIIAVKVPKRRITEAWIWLKKRFRREASQQGGGEMWTSDDPSSVEVSPARPRRLGFFGWLRRQLLAYDTLFQGNKRWLLLSLGKLIWRTRTKRFDLVIGSGPPMVSYICGWAAAKLKRAPLVLDYRDPWYLHGDKELTTVMLGHPLAEFENRLARRCAERCSALVAASPGTRRHILERFGVREDSVHIVRNGFDVDAVIDRPAPTGRLSLLYAGSLYWNRNPFPLLEALDRLLQDSDVERDRVACRLVGNCEHWKGRSVSAWVEERELQDVVRLHPFMLTGRLNELIAESNVLINFAQGQRRQIPAKSYEYIASRRSVLVITESDSDVAELFREARCGVIVEPQDFDGMLRALRDFYARYLSRDETPRGRCADATAYSRKAQLARFSEIVDDVLRDPATSGAT